MIGLPILAALALAADHAPPLPSDLPGDAALPSLDRQLAIPLGPPAGRSRISLPPVAPNTLPVVFAGKAAQAALAQCVGDGFWIGVAVVDEKGILQVGLSVDGASPGRIYVAIRKT